MKIGEGWKTEDCSSSLFQKNLTVLPVKFQRIRRITGYLVGDKETRFNDAKKAEERDRVKHTVFFGGGQA